MRLAYLARGRGDIGRALFWVEEASKSKAKAPVNQFCLKGKLLSEMGRSSEAASTFAYVLDKIVSDDSYCFLGRADLVFKSAIDGKHPTR
jgi:hypothetical protein